MRPLAAEFMATPPAITTELPKPISCLDTLPGWACDGHAKTLKEAFKPMFSFFGGHPYDPQDPPWAEEPRIASKTDEDPARPSDTGYLRPGALCEVVTLPSRSGTGAEGLVRL